MDYQLAKPGWLEVGGILLPPSTADGASTSEPGMTRVTSVTTADAVTWRDSLPSVTIDPSFIGKSAHLIGKSTHGIGSDSRCTRKRESPVSHLACMGTAGSGPMGLDTSVP